MGSFKVKNDGFLASLLLALMAAFVRIADKSDGRLRRIADAVATRINARIDDAVFLARHDKAGKAYASAFVTAIDGFSSDSGLKTFRTAFDRSIDDCKRRNLPTRTFLTFMAALDDTVTVPAKADAASLADPAIVPEQADAVLEPEIVPAVAYVPAPVLPPVPARLLKELRSRDASVPAIETTPVIVETAPIAIAPVDETEHYERFARRSSVVPLRSIALGDAPKPEPKLPERKKTLQGLQPVTIDHGPVVLLDESMRRRTSASAQ